MVGRDSRGVRGAEPPQCQSVGASGPYHLLYYLSVPMGTPGYFSHAGKVPKRAPARRAGPLTFFVKGRWVLGRGQGKHSSGVLVWFSVVLLLVAPFYYAIDECFVSGRKRKSVLCVVERSRTQADNVKTTSAANVPVSPPQAAKLAPQQDLLGDILKQTLRPYTRDPVRFRPNQPKGERKTKQKIKERFSRKPFLVFLSALLVTFPAREK